MVFQANDSLGSELDSIPQSQPAEQAVLGAILKENECYHLVSGIIKTKHFYNPIHARIYETCARLIEFGKLADAIILKNRFAEDPTLVDIGSDEYLANILYNAPPMASVVEYAKLIHDMAMRRELITLSEQIKSEACLLYTSPSPRDLSTCRMPSSA